MKDIDKAYKLGATSFLVEPMDFANTEELAKAMTKYWLVMNMTSGPTPAPARKTKPDPARN